MSKSILVVDDEKEVTLALKGFFTALGHDMHTALTGRDALRIIQESKPELILLDIRMPELNGIDLIKILKKDSPKTKIIVMTAFSKDYVDEVDKLGIDGFFKKPLDLVSLTERIKTLLDSKDHILVHPAKETESKQKIMSDVPRAKLLFVEPNPMVFGFMCGIFSVKEMIQGDYQVKVVYSAEEAMRVIYEYSPDLVIMYDNILHFEDVKRLAEVMMGTTHKPRSVILHGIFPKMDSEMRELNKLGIQYCNQSYLDDQGMRLINQRLADVVADTCLKHNLIKGSRGH